MDEIELSGVGLPSSVTTDSNGSPTSLTSTSPTATSPLTLNNHSADIHQDHEKKRHEQPPQKVI